VSAPTPDAVTLECWGGPFDGERVSARAETVVMDWRRMQGRYVLAPAADVKPYLRSDPALAALARPVWRWEEDRRR
jgi:hypothetical protein